MIHFFDEKDNLLEKSKIENNSKINTGLLQERRTLPATFYKENWWERFVFQKRF
jgi:ABC-type antimicrobial peptide transport system ATPase subunit